MSDKKKIGIIGGGITGLALGYYLSKLNFKVVIFEKGKGLGGLLGTFNIDKLGKIKLEKYYHHNFTNDKHILELVEDLGIKDEIEWHRAPMSVFIDNKFYPFLTPVDLLKFPHLSIISKLRLGLATVFLKIQKNREKYKNIKAAAWIEKYAGRQVWQTIWKPLFKGKFGEFDEEISLSWFWSRVKQRGHSANKKGEILGYPKRSYQDIIDKLEEKIVAANGQIYKETEVKKIEQASENRIKLSTELNSEVFDAVASTIALPLFIKLLPEKLSQFKKQLAPTKYIGSISAVLELKKPLTKYYWTNILDDDFSFRGVMEHTNFISRDRYLGRNLAYLSHYTATDSQYFKLDDKGLISAYTKHLKKINPDAVDLISRYWIFKDEYTQPIITSEYPRDFLTFKTPLDNLYFFSMAHIFPEDRGTDMAIKGCQKLAKLILKEHQNFIVTQKWNEIMYERYPTKRTYENKSLLVRFIEKQRVREVVKLAAIKSTDKVIEVGCEEGYILQYLQKAQEVVGLDIARNALKHAKKVINNKKVKFVCADATRIPFIDNHFSKVICSETLEHVNNPQKVVSEIHRIVQGGGEVIITVPYEKVLTNFKKLFVKLKIFNFLFPNIEEETSAWHIQNFDRQKILSLLNPYFEIIKFKWVPFWKIGPVMVIKCRAKKIKK